MDRLFLDANVLFSAAYRADSGLARFWKLKGAVLCSSRYALEEARVNLEETSQKRRLERLSRNIQFFEAAERAVPPGIVLPEKDAPILLAAFAARATHLITGDMRHFGPYLGTKIEGMLVVMRGEYLKSPRSQKAAEGYRPRA